MAWASSDARGTDDCVVVAQQSDETARDFSQRVCQRARRLRREDALIDSVDVYAGPANDRLSSAARREVIEQLGVQLATGGQLTLWAGSDDTRSTAEFSAILAQIVAILAGRQIAMKQQTFEREERSGVRHAQPKRPGAADFAFEDLLESDSNSRVPG